MEDGIDQQKQINIVLTNKKQAFKKKKHRLHFDYLWLIKLFFENLHNLCI